MRSKKVIYNICSNFLLQLILIIYGFVVPKLIISNYGSNVNGLISSITQFLSYIALLESGIGPVVKAALYKPIAKNNKEEISSILNVAEKFFKTISLIFILYIIILAIVYPNVVNKEFEYFFTFFLIIILSLSIFAEYYFGMVYKLFLQSCQKSYVISIIQIFTYIIAIILIAVMVKMNLSIHMIKLLSGLIFVSRPILQNYYVKKKYKINLKNSRKKFVLKNKWDGFAQHIAYVIHVNTDITILTIFSSLVEVSIYSVYSIVTKGVKAIIESFTSGIDSSFGDMIAKNEKNNLNKKFNIYEILYNIISTIAFTSAIILIVPFISIYTKGIKDANYIRYAFGVLIVISEFVWAIRQPYNLLIKSSGHFKETRIGAWIECLTNIIISIILVNKYGLIGVAIGTIVAMLIRTIEFVYHANKYILERSIWKSVKKILLVIVESLLIVFICKFLPFLKNINYINWIINALMVVFLSCIVTFILNFLFFKNEFKEVISILENILKKKHKI